MPPETTALAVGTSIYIASTAPASAVPASEIQLVLLVALLILLGLPHGATDAWIARRIGVFQKPLGWLTFNLAYLALALLVAGVWWQLPVFALSAFLVISAWHFSGDWSPSLAGAKRMLSGLSVLGLPAIFHPSEVAEIFELLAGPGSSAVAVILQWAGIAAMMGIVVLLIREALGKNWSVVSEFALLIVLAFAAPPLVYFTLYFCLLHSPRHFRSTLNLAGADQRANLAVHAAAYTLATVVIAVGLATFFLSQSSISDTALQTVFIGLAALTVPHMLVTQKAEQQ